MSFLTPAWLWLLAAIPLVIALHFLRNRRRHQLVSALFLWQVASDQANVRRRFALWWLLLLQILALAALAFALAQPVLLRSEEHTSELQSRGHLVCRLLL